MPTTSEGGAHSGRSQQVRDARLVQASPYMSSFSCLASRPTWGAVAGTSRHAQPLATPCPHSSQVGDGLFVMPSLPDALGEEAVSGGASGSRRTGRSGKRSGGASEAAAVEGGGFGGGLLLGQGQEEMALSLDGLPRHDLELL